MYVYTIYYIYAHIHTRKFNALKQGHYSGEVDICTIILVKSIFALSSGTI